MRLRVVGCGEATDPTFGSSSFLVTEESTLLVDCGYATPYFLLPQLQSAEELDGIYLTHFHADHTFGLPTLFLYLNDQEREKPLRVFGQPGTASFVEKLLDLAYPGIRSKFKFPLEFTESITEVSLNEFQLSFAPTIHSIPNYSIKVSCAGAMVGISGDGQLTDQSKELFSDISCLFHETYMLTETISGHTSVADIISFAKTLDSLTTLALIHLRQDQRQVVKESLETLSTQIKAQLILPQPGDSFEIQ